MHTPAIKPLPANRHPFVDLQPPEKPVSVQYDALLREHNRHSGHAYERGAPVKKNYISSTLDD